MTAAPVSLADAYLDRYATDPVLWVRESFGIEPDPWQVDVLKAYGRRDRQISLVSGHGVGKTTVLAWIIIHHSLCFFPQKTVATAPTEAQLYDALFAEVKSWIARLPKPIAATLDVKSDRVELKASPGESFFTVRTARPEKPEALAGVHSDWVLLIADEASGIPEPIFEAASGSMSGHHAITILAGNPVRTRGLFFDTHHRLKDVWTTFHVSCLNSPRVSADFVEDMKRRYGEHSNAFRVRVLGLFPRGDDDTIIPLELVTLAEKRDVAPVGNAPVIWGVDVAYTGDDRTVLAKRRGNVLLEPPAWKRGYDTMQTAGWIKMEYDSTPPHERPVEIMVDVIGFGAGVENRLRELKLPAIGINVSEMPAMRDKYHNLRTELWFEGREWFSRRDCKVPPVVKGENSMEDFIEELAAQTYEPPTSTGKVLATAKKKLKAKLGRSPDLADAFLLTFASPAGKAAYGSAGSTKWGEPLRRNIKGIV